MNRVESSGFGSQFRTRLERFIRRAFPARVFCRAPQWPSDRMNDLVGQALRLFEPQARFILAAKERPEAYLWTCLKNAVRDQVWVDAPEDVQRLHQALSSVIRTSNGIVSRRGLVGLAEWPAETPVCRAEFPPLAAAWKKEIKPKDGSGLFGLARGSLLQIVRSMLVMAAAWLKRAWIYRGVRLVLQVPQFLLGIPEPAKNRISAENEGTFLVSSPAGAVRPFSFENLAAVRAGLEELRPVFDRLVLDLFTALTPTQKFFAWSSHHGWKKSRIAESLGVRASRVSNLSGQIAARLKTGVDPDWTRHERQAFYEAWCVFLDNEPQPPLPIREPEDRP